MFSLSSGSSIYKSVSTYKCCFSYQLSPLCPRLLALPPCCLSVVQLLCEPKAEANQYNRRKEMQSTIDEHISQLSQHYCQKQARYLKHN